MRLLLAWFKKRLHIHSPSAHIRGYKYEYDMLKAMRKEKS